ncbi:MAG: PD-(D/E)XK nuclease family protein [Acidobacteria bacterium]|nr:PD-(D/E)XK nuclease family protein [Acidobacteriota bacterium]
MKILIGKANSGKTTRLLLRIAEVVGSNRGKPILLVPSSNSAAVFLERLTPFLPPQFSTQAQPLIITFPAFAEKLFRHLGKPYALLSTIERQRILQSIIAGLAEEKALEYFANNADKPGLWHSLAKFIDELWNSGTDAAAFAKVAQGGSKKDADIARIFRRYEARLQQRRVMDGESAPFFALQALQSISGATSLEPEKSLQKLQQDFPLVVADGFDFFTAVQVQLLSTISALGIETAAAFTYEAERAVHMWQQPTHQRCKQEAAEFLFCEAQPGSRIAQVAAHLMDDAKPESDNETEDVEREGVKARAKITAGNEPSLEPEPSVEQELSIEHEASVGHELSLENELSVEHEASVEHEPSLAQERLADQCTGDHRGSPLRQGATLCGRPYKQAITELAGRILSPSSTSPSDQKGAATMQIVSAADRAGEVRAVAREIKRLVLEEKISLDEITIVCRSLNLYADPLERVFAECAVPLELDNQLPLGENPFIVALLRLVNLHAEQFQRRMVITSLRSPYFDFSAFGFDDDRINLLEQISFSERIIQTEAQWQEVLGNPPQSPAVDAYEPASPVIDAPTKSTLLTKLNQFFTAVSFSLKATRAIFVRQILALLNTLKVEERMAQSDQAKVDAAAWQAFSTLLQTLGKETPLETFAQAKAINAVPPPGRFETSPQEINWSAFYYELESAVAATSFRRPSPMTAKILVQEAHNLRPRKYQAIFVIGLIEGEFPKKSTETTPYTLAEKKRLRQQGIDFSETINDAGADLTQFHKALTRAAERLYLSYARTDSSGGELLKSYLLDEVLAVANPADLHQLHLEKQNERTAIHCAASLEELALIAAARWRHHHAKRHEAHAALFADPLADMLAENLPSWPATRRGLAVEQRRLSGLEVGAYGGVFDDRIVAGKINAIFNEDYTWSATRLNDYGICPFRFFAKHLLNLAPIKEPSVGFAAEGLGIAYHKILEKTFRDLRNKGLTLSAATFDEAVQIAYDHCEATLQKMLDERLIRQSALWDFEKSEMKKRLHNLLRAEALWQSEQTIEPIRFEQSFGQGGQAPLTIESADGSIKIRGSIDRIDKQGDGLAVIDYKTSRSPINAKDALEGRNLQLPIYLLAAQRVLKLGEAVTGGYYLHIYSCKKGSEFPNKMMDMKTITEKAEAFIREYVSKARRAEFPIQPNQQRCPPYCEFDSLCRIQSLGAAVEEE